MAGKGRRAQEADSAVPSLMEGDLQKIGDDDISETMPASKLVQDFAQGRIETAGDRTVRQDPAQEERQQAEQMLQGPLSASDMQRAGTRPEWVDNGGMKQSRAGEDQVWMEDEDAEAQMMREQQV